jgi:hypothetical protein
MQFGFAKVALALLAVVSMAGVQAVAQRVHKDVAVGVSDVFVPGGFDSSSDAYVVATGVFPNGCYAWKGASVDHKTAFMHEVKTYATVSEGMCIMVLVPFTKEIALGKMASGKHTLRFLGGDGTYMEKAMAIE